MSEWRSGGIDNRRPPSFDPNSPPPAPPPTLVVRPRRGHTVILLILSIIAAPWLARYGLMVGSPDWHDTASNWSGQVLEAMPPALRLGLFELTAAVMALGVITLAPRLFLPYSAVIDEDGVRAWGVVGYRTRPWADFTLLRAYGERSSRILILSTAGRTGRGTIQIPVGKMSDASLEEALTVVRFYRPDLVAEMLSSAKPKTSPAAVRYRP